MASVVDDPNGRRRILFVAPDEKRKTIRLGKIDRKSAESICRHVEHLLAGKINGQPLPRDTAAWLTEVGAALKDKLAAVGLVAPPPAKATVENLLSDYLGRADVKESTKTVRATWGKQLKEHFGARLVSDIGPRDAEALRDALVRRELAGPTVGRVLRFARQLFALAVRRDILTKNPFDTLAYNFREGAGKPRDFAEADDVERLLAVCAPCWRVLIALGRYGALRCPSEALILRWADVNLPERRLTVRSPKTESQGKAWRVVPIAPALAPVLEEAWALAEGHEYVVDMPQYRVRAGNWIGCNLRTQLTRLMKRANVPCWSRPFRVLRSSCVSDWAKDHPIHAVAAWAGHTVPVAGKHYLTVTDGDFRRATGTEAAQKAAQQIPAGTRTGSQSSAKQNPEVVVTASSYEVLRFAAKEESYPARIRT
ncbi:MAG: site-specific integrase [Planctomycetes bacterium]|nr:site-specific integrase [Planctomycetota bacterium]